MDSDCFGFGTCIRCDVRDDLVLVCGERGCAIAVHENCMGCDAMFEASSGKFRCPFCEQKLALARVKETRKKVLEAKRALSRFLGEDVTVGDDARKNIDLDRVVGDIEEQNWLTESEEEVKDDETEESGLFVEKRKNEDIDETEDDDDDDDGDVDDDDDGDVDDDDDDEKRDTEDIEEVEVEVEGDDDDEKRENGDIEGMSERVCKRNLRRKAGKKENLRSPSLSERPSTMLKPPVSREKAVVKSQAANAISNMHFPREKRRRLAWTEEEEEMLREGVQMCCNGKGNRRWVKILEYGRSVFHETRIPGDLKYKWMGIMVKDGIRP